MERSSTVATCQDAPSLLGASGACCHTRRIANPKVDELSMRALNTFDPATRDALVREIHETTSADAVRIFIVSDLNPRALSPTLSGFVQAQSWFQDINPVVVGK
jgi:peptide/nickel transport system substrate-binding protein